MSTNNALHTAAKEGDLVTLQSLVMTNFDINTKGEDYGTALYWAARQGHAEVVKLLLSFNPDVNIPDVSTINMISIPMMICVFFPLSQ